MQAGTRMLGRAKADAAPEREPSGPPGDGSPGRESTGDQARADQYGPARPPGVDGTLLAVVPIPGTGTSLAIVGYPVPAPASGPDAAAPLSMSPLPAGPIPFGPIPPGLVRDGQVLARAGLAGLGAAVQSVIGHPGLLLDHEQRRVLVDGAEVTLTFQEFELLAFLATHPATVFTRADLVSKVWQRDFTADSRTVDVHVSRLRRKLGPAYGRCLVTEYRVGYQFRPPEA